MHKLTAAPAARIGLTDRGTLAPGKAADIVVFDPAAYREAGTLDDPNHLAQGVRHVLVNGGIAPKQRLHHPPHRPGPTARVTARTA